MSWRAAYRGATKDRYHACPSWSHFGPVRPNGKWHRGFDIAAPTGTPVRAAVAGVLSYRRDPKGWGFYAQIRYNPQRHQPDGSCKSGEEMHIVYAHLVEDRSLPLYVDQPVAQGAIVGHVGCSGNATGMCSPSLEPHVHVTFRRSDDHVQVDPALWVPWEIRTPEPSEFSPQLLACPVASAPQVHSQLAERP